MNAARDHRHVRGALRLHQALAAPLLALGFAILAARGFPGSAVATLASGVVVMGGCWWALGRGRAAAAVWGWMIYCGTVITLLTFAFGLESLVYFLVVPGAASGYSLASTRRTRRAILALYAAALVIGVNVSGRYGPVDLGPYATFLRHFHLCSAAVIGGVIFHADIRARRRSIERMLALADAHAAKRGELVAARRLVEAGATELEERRLELLADRAALDVVNRRVRAGDAAVAAAVERMTAELLPRARTLATLAEEIDRHAGATDDSAEADYRAFIREATAGALGRFEALEAYRVLGALASSAPARVDLRALLREACRRAGAEPAVHVADEAVRPLLIGPLLTAAVEPLLDNALRHGGGCVAIAAHLVGGGRALRIELTDEGRGIPAAYRDRLTRLFERLDADERLGTGLALAAKAAAGLGGGLALDHGAADGTTVVLLVPLAPADPPHARPAARGPGGPLPGDAPLTATGALGEAGDRGVGRAP